VAAQAPTGSGKTLAFGLPMLQRIAQSDGSAAGSPRGLVLAPTRELARQIALVLAPLASVHGLTVHEFYGGVPIEPQIQACEDGVDVAVACPGRLLDLIERGHIALGDVRIAVVDEADRLADLGFMPDVDALLAQTPADRQTLLFSATLDGDVDVLIGQRQRAPVRHRADDTTGQPALRHHLWAVHADERTELTAAIVDHCGPTMVFVRTRQGADRLARQLTVLRVSAAAMHGGNSQVRRDAALDDFRAGRLQALVATDVAARGVHVDGVACVVQYDLPDDVKDYVHRAGRTARGGASGAVVTLVPPAVRGRALAMLRSTLGPDEPDEHGDAVVVEAPDLDQLESKQLRRSIDHQLAQLDLMKRPGHVGSVAFDRPRLPDGRVKPLNDHEDHADT
jgi:superfamily II DNA/RNA helicase